MKFFANFVGEIRIYIVEVKAMNNEENNLIKKEIITNKIYTIRGVQVMLDSDLAELYGYETKNFNRQVKNNALKFEGEDFMFQLNDEETENLSRCKNFTLKDERLHCF